VFYGNLGVYFAKHGYLTIVANYRLAPAGAWPAGAQDVAGAVAWAKANGAQYGGDPSRIIVYGQSAGSTHVATYLFDPQFKAEGIAAGILMSGSYTFVGPLRENAIAYVGADESKYAARSPLTHVNSSRVPLMLSVAEYDPAFLAWPTFELAAAVTRRDSRAPFVAYMAGHNHVSTVQSFGSGQDDVGEKVREFLKRF
jgi:triacylglycerol lipase